jgi:hypothetical protein
MEIKVKQDKVFVRPFWGKRHWVMERSKVCKFSTIRLWAAFFVLSMIYLTSKLESVTGDTLIAVTTALAVAYVNFLGGVGESRVAEKDLDPNLGEMHTSAPLILFLAVLFAAIALVQRALIFYQII